MPLGRLVAVDLAGFVVQSKEKVSVASVLEVGAEGSHVSKMLCRCSSQQHWLQVLPKENSSPHCGLCHSCRAAAPRGYTALPAGMLSVLVLRWLSICVAMPWLAVASRPDTVPSKPQGSSLAQLSQAGWPGGPYG
eukprot:5845439-Amphidinium_carterae.1